ncbi:unnamed protein product [Mytilus edulis]|uniref:Uncharacterized protein n=1 Tax=Mytilus edulis TaxID=6550 RepID=A0A8S3QTG8_MYTED|nr:unnamed protein product [Mytilus edulis]
MERKKIDFLLRKNLEESESHEDVEDGKNLDPKIRRIKRAKKAKWRKDSRKTENQRKSREEIVEEAVSSLQKITETPSVVTPDDDNYQVEGLLLMRQLLPVETVTEEPVMAEQAQNETDLAILSILQFDDKSGSFPETLPQQNALVSEPQPEVPPENVVVEPEQITLDTNPLDSSIGSENDLVIDTSTPDQVELQNDINLPITAPIKETRPTSVPVNLQKGTILPAMPPVQEKPLEHKEKPKSRRNQKAKEQIELLNAQKRNNYQQDQLDSLQGGDASEKENEEKLPQPYNFDVEKHEDADNPRVSGERWQQCR